MDDKIRNMLGLGMKAGNIVSGEDTCKIEIKKMRVLFVIVATDASDNTKKMFADKANYRSIPIRFMGTKEELGQAIGKVSRAVIGVKEKGLALKLIELIDRP